MTKTTAMENLEALVKLLEAPSYAPPRNQVDTFIENMEGLFRALDAGKEERMNAAKPEPAPVKNDQPAIADIVAAELVAMGSSVAKKVAQDVMARKAFGMAKYGTALQPFNGRNSHMDLYQELVDALKYARLLLFESQFKDAASKELLDTYRALSVECIKIRRLMDYQNDERQSSQASDEFGG